MPSVSKKTFPFAVAGIRFSVCRLIVIVYHPAVVVPDQTIESAVHISHAGIRCVVVVASKYNRYVFGPSYGSICHWLADDIQREISESLI